MNCRLMTQHTQTPPESKLNTEDTTETNLTDAPSNTEKDETGRHNVFK